MRSPLAVVVLVIALSLAAFGAIQLRGRSVPAVAVVRHDLEQHLVASGRVMAPARIEVSMPLTGIVTDVPVREGDRVKVGDVLLQVDESEARAMVAQAEAALAQAKVRADQVRSVTAVVAGRALEQAEATYGAADKQFERLRTLFASGAATSQELEDARRALDVARAQRDAAQTSLASSSPRGVEARAAWAAASQAEAQLAAAKARLSQTRAVARADAIVLRRDVEPGFVVTPGKPLLVLSAIGETRIVLQPDERDLPLVRLGLAARVSADAFPKDSFPAAVSYIAPSVEAQRGTIEVRLRVPEPPAYLRPDMTVSVDMTVASVKDALVVPSLAVRGLATPEPWTLVASGGRAERRALVLGVRGDGSVEVKSGAALGELLVMPDGTAVKPGDRVRAARKD